MVLPEHFVLSEKDGFPPPPDVVVVVKSGLSRFNDGARRFGEISRRRSAAWFVGLGFHVL